MSKTIQPGRKAATRGERATARKRSERPLAFEVRLPLPMDTAISRVTDALKAEGFGILTRIDANEIFLEKLGVAFGAYTILGACNPSLALRALTARPETGLLLPCNVTVEKLMTGDCLVRIVDPLAQLEATGLSKEPEVLTVATESAERLERTAQWLRDHGHAAVL